MNIDLHQIANSLANCVRQRPSYYSREDVVQDALVILLQQKYPPDCKVEETIWRWRDAKRKLRDYLRSKTRYTGELTEPSEGEIVDPDPILDLRDALSAVGLTETERAVLLLLYEDSLTQTEVAARLRLSQSRVYQIKKEAQEKLRGYLSDPEGDLYPGPVVSPRHERPRDKKPPRRKKAAGQGA